jgi:hypothetical protein
MIVLNAINFLGWVLIGAILLPCVVVTAVFYPMWEKWGDMIEG